MWGLLETGFSGCRFVGGECLAGVQVWLARVGLSWQVWFGWEVLVWTEVSRSGAGCRF